MNVCVCIYIYIWRQCILYIYCKQLQFQLFFYSGFSPFVHTYGYKHIYIWYIIYIHICIYVYMYILWPLCYVFHTCKMKHERCGKWFAEVAKTWSKWWDLLKFLEVFCWCQSLRNYTYTYTYPYPDADWYTYNIMYTCTCAYIDAHAYVYIYV